MMQKQVGLGAAIAGPVLFLWNVISSYFPWGAVIVTPIGDKIVADRLAAISQNGMLYYNTGKQLAFIVLSDYNPSYARAASFLWEMPQQLLIGFGISYLFWALSSHSLFYRIKVICIAVLVFGAAVHVSYFNWWGFGWLYTLGAVVNQLAGVLLSIFAVYFALYAGLKKTDG